MKTPTCLYKLLDKTGQNGQNHENLSRAVQPLVRLDLLSASGQTGQIGQNFKPIYKLKYFFSNSSKKSVQFVQSVHWKVKNVIIPGLRGRGQNWTKCPENPNLSAFRIFWQFIPWQNYPNLRESLIDRRSYTLTPIFLGTSPNTPKYSNHYKLLKWERIPKND